MNGQLHAYGLKHGTDKATYHGYCDFYQDHLPKPGEVTRLLEIGVMQGASLRMWHDYYSRAFVYGVEIDLDRIASARVDGCGLIHADATDAEEVRELIAVFGPFDVIIDDGSHMTADQQRSFELLWPSVRPGGCYVIEDLHTSYMANYVNSEQTTIERVDEMARWVEAGILADVSDIRVFNRSQGDPAEFVARHGFPTDRDIWIGSEVAESITATIVKAS